MVLIFLSNVFMQWRYENNFFVKFNSGLIRKINFSELKFYLCGNMNHNKSEEIYTSRNVLLSNFFTSSQPIHNNPFMERVCLLFKNSKSPQPPLVVGIFDSFIIYERSVAYFLSLLSFKPQSKLFNNFDSYRMIKYFTDTCTHSI